MTLEELLGMSADELEKMTSQEVTAFFEPYLKYTRPDLVAEELKKNPPKNTKVKSTPEDDEQEAKIAKAKKMAEQYGFDLGFND